MVFPLPPKSRISSGINAQNTPVSTTAISRSTVKQLPMIFSARSCSPRPMAMAARGAPPEPASMAKAVISMRMGVNRPTPVRAWAPISGMWPI